MITEDYCSYEVAKLLKEKGFPQEYDKYHSMVYNEEDYEDEYEVQRMVVETKLVKAGTLSSYPVGVPEPKCYCPTHQMAMKWLRDVYDIHISVNKIFLINDMDNKPYLVYVCTEKCNTSYNAWSEYHSTYEQAVEAALEYCLTELI